MGDKKRPHHPSDIVFILLPLVLILLISPILLEIFGYWFPTDREEIIGIINDVDISMGGWGSHSIIMITFEDGQMLTFKYYQYNFQIGKKYQINYSWNWFSDTHPKIDSVKEVS